MFEREIYPRGDECWRENEAGDLNLESEIGIWIRVHNNSSPIADCFADGAERQNACEEVGFALQAEEKLEDGSESEECYEEGIYAERGIIAVDSVIHGAGWSNFRAVEGDAMPHVEGWGSVEYVLGGLPF